MRAWAQQTDPEMKRQVGAAAVGQQDGNGLLEPCAVKVACTVLRGGMGSNAHPLPENRSQAPSPLHTIFSHGPVRAALLMQEASGVQFMRTRRTRDCTDFAK